MWLEIHEMNFKKEIESTEATIKGYLDQERKNVRSTKISPTSHILLTEETDDAFPEQAKTKQKIFLYDIGPRDARKELY